MAEEQNFSAWLRSSDIQASIGKCQALFNSGIFSSEQISTPLFESAVTFMLINLNDLVAKANKDGMRIVSTDHIEVADKIKDLTDLIRECRNAASHVGSGENMFEGVGKFTFNVASGFCPRAFNLYGIVLGCDFADDIAIYYGDKRIYLRRHLLFAFETIVGLYPAK